MAPAFSSQKQAGAFALLLLAILLSPVIFGKSILPPREEVYSDLGYRFGPYHYLRRQIFDQKGDIDIAFIGSSRVLHGIDTIYVQKELSKALGRKANVITLGFSWAGFDALYFVTRDLLRHRKVHLIAFAEELRGEGNPHHAIPHLFRWAEDSAALEGLPLSVKAAYYFGAIMGMPRNVLSLLRPNLSVLSSETALVWDKSLRAQDPAETLGAAYAKLGFGHAPAKYVAYAPPSPPQPAAAAIYSPETKEQFRFQGAPAAPLQLHFARLFAKVAQAGGSKLVCLHLPESGEWMDTVIQEREFWPTALHGDVAMIGIPPAKLFAGKSEGDILKFYLDQYHFNKNGEEYFTPWITPALIQLYDSENRP